jgi:hypothetical protein
LVNWIREPFSDLVDLKENCDFCQGSLAILHERLQVRCHELGSRCLAMHELSCAAIDQGNKLEGDDSSSPE